MSDSEEKLQKVIKHHDSITLAEHFFSPSSDTLSGRTLNKEFTIVFSNLPLSCRDTDKLRALDIGCSGGRYMQALLDRGFDSHGLDTGMIPLLYAKAKIGSANLYQASITDLPFKEETFDLVICIELLHHLTDDVLKNALTQISDVTKSNGFFVFDVKNSLNPYVLYRYNKRDNVTRKLTLKARSVYKMTRLVERAGFKVINKKGIFSPVILFAPIVVVFCKKS